jgi:hypothetical protein
MLGEQITDLKRLPMPDVFDRPDQLRVGEIIHVDHFGNLISNIPGQNLPEQATVTIDNRMLGSIRQTYGDVGVGKPLALVGSHGFVEVAVRQGSAADALGIGRGASVEIRLG